MKQVILFLFISISINAQIDTVFTELTPVRQKKTTIKFTTTLGDEITEKRETIDYEKAIKKIEQLTMDTSYYNDHIRGIMDMEVNIEKEKRRVKLLKKDAIATLDRLKKILPTLK